MYIDLNAVYVILAILACVALGYLIGTLRNVNKLVKNANELVEENKAAINSSIKRMPKVVANCSQITENVKDVSEVATDMTAEFLVKKESMESNFQVVTDIFTILKSVFGR